MDNSILKIVVIIGLRVFEAFVICLLAYGVMKKDEPGDTGIFVMLFVWFVACGLLEKFL